MDFGNKLNYYIKLLDCSSKDICNISDLSPSLFSRYLNNKRTPKVNSIYFNKIVDAIYEISLSKNLNIDKKDIYDDLKNDEIDYQTFIDNFNKIQKELDLSISNIAKSIGYDNSFLSRIKNGERKPADLNSFIEKLSYYINCYCKKNNKEDILSSILKCSISDLNEKNKYNSLFYDWIITFHEQNTSEKIINFLSTINSFNLNDYICTDFSKVKVPTSPIIFKNSKTYFGINGRKKAEAEFLKTTLLSKSNEPIFFYSNLPMSEAGDDELFKKKWIIAMTMILKKGLHLNIIHNLDRPINELFLGLESWIPIYMTGSISPYYLETPLSNYFQGSLCTSGVVSLTSECIKFNEKNSKFYLTTKKDELTFEKQKSKYILSKAKPLMKIFKENDNKSFKKFLNEKDNKNFKIIKKNIFNNIDFYINNKWIIVNKNTSPEIHFIIYNEKLKNAILAFLETN